ncbi:MAG: hypothetical protein JSW61_08370 [Candidatus Thorarchaeota archaeon]|nr:MAG: hypothetical protein JSW61_08370 [Candidatus Thorarchaeota archaeon]
MYLKGMDKFREKLPKYTGRKIALLGLVILATWTAVFILLLLADSIARLYPQISVLVTAEPVIPVVAALIVQLMAFGLIWRVWHNKDRFRKELGDLAYQKAIPRGLFGVSLVVAVCLHIYVPIGALPFGPPVNDLTTALSEPFLSILGVPFEIDISIRVLGALFFIILGMLTVRSAVFTFGIDYMALVYLYFPEESEIQQHEIYSVLRHPAYFAVLSFALGGFLFQMSVYSFSFFFMFFLGLMAHILLVEEKELEERFGDSFREYRQRVPALRIRAQDLRKFFRFLTKKGTE